MRTNTTKVKPQTALAFLKGKPYWELTSQEIVYYLKVDNAIVRFHLSPYSPKELKSALANVSRGVTGDEQDVDFIPDDDSKYIPLVEKHFLRMSGTSADEDTDKQKNFLKLNPEITIGIAKQGFLGLDLVNSSKPENAVLDIEAGSQDGMLSIDAEQSFYSPEKNKYEKVLFSHIVIKARESGFRIYRRSLPRSMNVRSRELKVMRDYDAVENLYRDMVVKGNGFLLDGEKCEESNKKGWVPLIPLAHKILVIDEIFGQVRVKKT